MDVHPGGFRVAYAHKNPILVGLHDLQVAIYFHCDQHVRSVHVVGAECEKHGH